MSDHNIKSDSVDIGRHLLQKDGWHSGKGLGKNEDGSTSHVKTSRKDNVRGIGYDGAIEQTGYSAQSVGFADILRRVNEGICATRTEGGDDSNNEEPSTIKDSSVGVVGNGKHGNAYLKRRSLKTEALRSDSGKREILLILDGKRQREVEDEGGSQSDKFGDLESHLVSPLLQRLMHRHPPHEPKGHRDTPEIIVAKPDPRPPRCTASPFLDG